MRRPAPKVNSVTRTKRIKVFTYKVVKMTKAVRQVERPYVLFGEAIREARYERGWNQQELADRLGYSRGSIANIEVGRQRILLTDLFVFAKVLKLDPGKLFASISKGYPS